MMIRLAWRNIWRNRRRSLIVLTSVIVGIIVSIFIDCLSMGMVIQGLEKAIGAHVSHMQISARGYAKRHLVQSTLPDPAAAEAQLAGDPRVAAFTPRVIARGLASTAAASAGVIITGVEPERERRVTTISSMMTEGRYLGSRPREIVIGRVLAEKLQLGLGGKLVLMTSRANGEIGSELFRVVGLFETNSRDFDRGFAYITIADAQALTGLGSRITTIAVRMHEEHDAAASAASLRAHLGPGTEVLSYKELIPMLVMFVDLSKQSLAIVYIIVGVALLFGIVNTMLMSVFERIHEFGVLMAMGMKPRTAFAMIMVEALMLGMTGALLGLAGGLALYAPLTRTGIDLSLFSEGLRAFGSGSVVYPVLTVEEVIYVLVIIPFFTVLGALLPAFKAARMQPAQAIRHV